MKMNSLKAGTSAVLALAMVAAFAQDDNGQVTQGNGITVTVDGRPLHFRGTPARMVDGRVLVPLRGIFERLGARVDWNPQQRQVMASRGPNNVQLQIGNTQATVDGRQVTLDVPAQIIDGATMVPIRFVSESIGAEVKWREAEQMVVISSGDRGRAQPIYMAPPPGNPPMPNRPHEGGRAMMIEPNSVIPVTLDTPLSSEDAQPGQRFSTTVRTNGTGGYLPDGTRIFGIVSAAQPRRAGQPGILDLRFNRIQLPDGTGYPINGRLIGLNEGGISQGQNGMLMARGDAGKDVRHVFVGGPDGRSMVIVWGRDFGRNNPRDVNLEQGTQFGVRLIQGVTLRAGHELR